MPATLSTPCLFALAETDQPLLVWWVIGALMALGPVLHSYIKVYDWLKGKGIDTSQFVTKTELAAVRAERDAELSRTVKHIESKIDEAGKDYTKLERLLTELSRELAAIHRSLGRLEGHDEAQVPKRPR